jgi:2-methylaconitate cis-trans-isomerase PrpF
MISGFSFAFCDNVTKYSFFLNIAGSHSTDSRVLASFLNSILLCGKIKTQTIIASKKRIGGNTMRKFKAVMMRGGTSKGLMFHKKDLPADQHEWDEIFLKAMGNPDPKQIDGLGGCVSSNNKIVVVWPSERNGVDVEYLVGQVVVGRWQIDYKANCGNMTGAVAPFAIEEGITPAVSPLTCVRLFNHNTEKRIDVTVPVENGTFAEHGECAIAGIDGTAAPLTVDFLEPAGSKTGKLLPTGRALDEISVAGFGVVRATLLDVSNPLVVVRAEDVGLTGCEMPGELEKNRAVCDLLESVRGISACMMGLAASPDEATAKSPGIPKIAFFTAPCSYTAVNGSKISAEDMDLCVRVISVFQLHKASPLTSANALAVAACLKGGIVDLTMGAISPGSVRLGHPSGIMTMLPRLRTASEGAVEVMGVASLRTARRLMEGTVLIPDKT